MELLLAVAVVVERGTTEMGAVADSSTTGEITPAHSAGCILSGSSSLRNYCATAVANYRAAVRGRMMMDAFRRERLLEENALFTPHSTVVGPSDERRVAR